ncbi:MAG TPA: hypothetical protein VEJ86_06945 [Candidatus Binataceae bacterium]|nr:hypothetical protein [Candidatus Binataceae bacterium]
MIFDFKTLRTKPWRKFALLGGLLALTLYPLAARAANDQSPSANAPAPDTNRENALCEHMGKIAESMAHARDSGETREDMLNFIHASFHGSAAQVPEALVPAIYDNPKLTPDQARDVGVKTCHHLIAEGKSSTGAGSHHFHLGTTQ